MNRLFGVKKKAKEPEAPVNAPTLGEASERVSKPYSQVSYLILPLA